MQSLSFSRQEEEFLNPFHIFHFFSKKKNTHISEEDILLLMRAKGSVSASYLIQIEAISDLTFEK